ncbi:unnamed protein product [Musa acuminata var. zebrina]
MRWCHQFSAACRLCMPKIGGRLITPKISSSLLKEVSCVFSRISSVLYAHHVSLHYIEQGWPVYISIKNADCKKDVCCCNSFRKKLSWLFFYLYYYVSPEEVSIFISINAVVSSNLMTGNMSNMMLHFRSTLPCKVHFIKCSAQDSNL